ncbi:MAG: restriction endonuclease [Flavobacteriales bacterium]|nr:restriction endonuclease [Flavobacteriales bacterium]
MDQKTIRAFVVRADGGSFTQDFLKREYVGIGWSELGDVKQLSSRADIEKQYETVYPKDSKMRRAINVGQVNRFINGISIGDVVLSPGEGKAMHVGRVVGKAVSLDNERYRYQRKIDWSLPTLPREELSQTLQNTLRSMLSCYEIKRNNEVLVKLGIVSEDVEMRMSPAPVDPVEAARARLLDRLNGDDFEYLVGYVLEALGFELSQRHGKPGDGGVDLEGNLNVQGIASIALRVQAKRYENNRIHPREISGLRGVLKEGQQGCFITLSSFQEKAKKLANEPGYKPVTLISGERFIELLFEYYERIRDAAIEDDNEDLIQSLGFKRILLPE